MRNVRPSDGKTTDRPHLDLNVRGYRPGERVLYAGFGGPRIGTIDRLTGNSALLGVETVQVTEIKGRVPAGADEEGLLEALRAADRGHARAVQAAREQLQETTAALLRKHGVR